MAGTTRAVTISIVAAADTSLFEGNPDANLGSATLVSGTIAGVHRSLSRSRALFRFDLSSIPPGSIIQQARVTISVVRRPDPDQGASPGSDFSLYRLLESWGEGSGTGVTGSFAQPGDATWNSRLYLQAGWSSPGAQADTDYVAAPSSTTSVSGVGPYTFEGSATMVADVQSWVDDAAANFGFILASADEYSPGTARRWASLEQPTGGIPATLTVDYLPPTIARAEDSFNSATDGTVFTIATESGGRLIVGGDFTTISGGTRNRVARLNGDGTLDGTFAASADGVVECVAIEGDGHILIGGSFTMINGAVRAALARLSADGTLDALFVPQVDGPVHGIAVQADRKIVLAGAFAHVAGAVRHRLARLQPDGTLDMGFTPDVDDEVLTAVLQQDGKMVIGGLFTKIDGVSRAHVARLNPDGTLDGEFDPGADDIVQCAAMQPDGRIVFGGKFTSVGGNPHGSVARVNADGGVDGSFSADAGPASSSVFSLALQTDGRLLVAGDFTSISGVASHHFVRLNGDGSRDPSFNPSPVGLVQSIALDADGKVLLGGNFTQVGGATRNNLARLSNDPAMQSLTVSNVTRVQWQRGGTSPEIQQVGFEISNDGGTTWSPLGRGTRVADVWELRGLDLPPSCQLRAHGRNSAGKGDGSSGLIEASLIRTAAPLATTGAASAVGSGTATLSASVDANNLSATPMFEFGLSEAYGDSIATIPSTVTGDGSTAVSATLSGLAARTTYHYRLKAENAAGISYGADATFTTGNSAPVPGSPATVNAPSGRSTLVDVLGMASDADGDPVTVFAGAALHGTVTITGGQLFYLPDPGFAGADLLSYTLSDGFGGFADGSVILSVAPRPAQAVADLFARKGQAVPGAGLPGSGTAALPMDSTWESFGIPSVNDGGQVAFLATVTTGARSRTSGLFAGDPQAPVLMALSGQAANDVPGALFAALKDPLLAQDGSIAFLATLANAPGQHVVTSDTNHGLWTNANGALRLVARTGHEADGAPIGAKWSKFLSFALADGVTGPLFTAQISGVPHSADTGLWAADAGGTLHLLLRESDLIEGEAARNFAVLTQPASVPGQTRSFNQAGEIALRVTFVRGSQGIVKISAP